MTSSSGKTYTERCLETLIELVDLMRKQQATGFEETKAAIDALTLNISQLAQQQKQTAANLDKVSDRIDRLASAIDGHLTVAQSQTANIAALTALASKLLDRAA
jgi:phage-related minor tail protein